VFIGVVNHHPYLVPLACGRKSFKPSGHMNQGKSGKLVSKRILGFQ